MPMFARVSTFKSDGAATADAPTEERLDAGAPLGL